MRNIADLIASQARRHAAKPFLFHPDTSRECDYAEMERASNRAANLLRRHGAGKGERIAICLPNIPEFFHLFLGVAKTGAVAVPLRSDLKEAEYAQVFRHCEPRIFVVDTEVAGRIRTLAGRFPWLETRIPRGSCPGPERSFAESLSAESEDYQGPTQEPTDPLMILYTSGTTGKPKGIVHTHGSALALMDAVRRRYELDESHRGLCMLPMDSTLPLISNSLAFYFCGGSLVLRSLPKPGELLRLWEVIERFHVTSFCCTPSFLPWFAHERHPEAPSLLRSLRFVICTGSPLSPRWAREFLEAYGVPIFNHYGSSEAGFVSARRIDASERPEAAVGRPVSYGVKILDSIGKEVPEGSVGEIVVKGDGLMLGYYQRPDLTSEVLKEGWYHTGDLGRLERGELFLEGRARNIIIKNGRNVFAEEIDGILCRHAGVREAATVGWTEPNCGEERIVSFVVLRPGARETAAGLIRHCRSFVSDISCPDCIRFLGALPRNARGKVDRKRLLALLMAAPPTEGPG